MTKEIEVYRPEWIEPEHLQKLGYRLLSDKDGYLKYESSWESKALHRKGRTFEQLLGDGKRIIYFNLTYQPQDSLVFCGIEEDGGTRTVYNGVLFNDEQLEFILNAVE